MARKVSYVYQGSESPERFELLVSQTGLRSSQNVYTIAHLIEKGYLLEDAVNFHEIKKQE